MHKLISLALAVIGALLVPLGYAADEATPQGRIPTVTRWVKVFTELEISLAASVRGGDEAALQKLLTEDFELRIGAMPANPTPRAEWIRQSLAQRGASFDIEQMAIHDLGGQALVSFVQVPVSGAQRTLARSIFVVDLWKRAGDEWRLAVRYASPAGSRDFIIPGAVTQLPAIPKKY